MSWNTYWQTTDWLVFNLVATEIIVQQRFLLMHYKNISVIQFVSRCAFRTYFIKREKYSEQWDISTCFQFYRNWSQHFREKKKVWARHDAAWWVEDSHHTEILLQRKSNFFGADGRTALGCVYLCYREHAVFVPGLERNSPRLAQNELLNDHIIWQLSGV